jgi:glucosamine--fructose-6-phosphate aminotransferase (isomerizing)
MTPYISDILSQPGLLRSLIDSLGTSDFEDLLHQIRKRSRVVLTGMGASFAALLPAWRTLVTAGIPAWHIDTAELLSISSGLLAPETLIIAASQSGRSAELLSLADRARHRCMLVAITNDSTSPLAKAASTVIEIHAGTEHAVSTKSYVNTMAAIQLMIAGLAVRRDDTAWNRAADAIETYLERWHARVESLVNTVGLPERLMILGRGDSIAATIYGGLIAKEAAKRPVEGMSSAQFRHGPMELTDARLTALVLGGSDQLDRERNARLAHDIVRFGGRAVWLDTEAIAGLPLIEIPNVPAVTRAVAEAVVLQLLNIALAEQTAIEPGVFRHLNKVTTIE